MAMLRNLLCVSALVLVVLPMSFAGRLLEKQICVGNDSTQCVKVSYDPCQEVLGVGGSLMQPVMSQTVQLSQLRGNGFKQCQHVDTDKLRELINKINAASQTDIDDNAIRVLGPFAPELCVDVSSQDITSNQEELHLHVKVTLHATRDLFGWSPPDIPLFQRDEDLGQSCHGRSEGDCLSQPLCGVCGSNARRAAGQGCVLGDRHGAMCHETCSSWRHRDIATAEDERDQVIVDPKAVKVFDEELAAMQAREAARPRKSSHVDSSEGILIAILGSLAVLAVAVLAVLWYRVRSAGEQRGQVSSARQLWQEDSGMGGHHILVDQDFPQPPMATVIVASEPLQQE